MAEDDAGVADLLDEALETAKKGDDGAEPKLSEPKDKEKEDKKDEKKNEKARSKSRSRSRSRSRDRRSRSQGSRDRFGRKRRDKAVKRLI
eukprot:symbB.v1.2.030667.t1/scaffold3433.1/size56802/1